MVFTVTSSECKVKKARLYEFLSRLGWRTIENKSFYKFPAPKLASFRKYTILNFRVFRVRDTKIGMLSHWKKPFLLIFSSLTISSIKRCVFCTRMLALEWKGRAFIEKVNSRCFCWFPAAKLSTDMASPYKALQRCVKCFGKSLRNCGPQRPEIWKNCLYQ